jgi:ABC-type molybdate transport system substrate-binding protein
MIARTRRSSTQHARHFLGALLFAATLCAAACSRSDSQNKNFTDIKPIEIFAPPQLAPILDSLVQDYYLTQDKAFFISTGSNAFLELQLRSPSLADLLIIIDTNSNKTTPDPTLQIIPWLGERLVLFTHAQNPAITLKQLPDSRGTIAAVAMIEPQGIYTRLALRSVNLWNTLETRVRLRTTPQIVVRFVVEKQDRFGIAYASQIPADAPLKIIADLDLPKSVQTHYSLIPLTDQGTELALWLISQPVLQKAQQAGYTQ